MANVALSARLKKLTKDFALVDGKIQLPFEKMHAWMGELDKVPEKEKRKLAEEMIALAMKLERDDKEATGVATAQLYTFVASVLKYSGPEGGKGAGKPAAKGAKPAASGGGWGAKPKR